MKFFLFLFAVFLFAMESADSKELDYKLVLTAGTGTVDGRVVRFLTFFEDACLTVQNVVPGDVGRVAAEARICSLDGRDISSDFVDVTFKRGVFTDKGLFFDVSATPFRPLGERKLLCQVKFVQGVADHLSCVNANYDE
ncbi:hypothetical protein D3C76_142160 [compost metagenome]